MNDFTRILQSTGSQLAKSAKEAIDWFKDSLSSISKKQKADPNKVFTKNASPEIGSMYLFVYDAKNKATLPFFDKYPLVFPIEFYSNGFLGLNLHYLPPLARANLLNSLKATANNNKYDDTTKLVLSYEILKLHSIKFQGYQSCIKRYLFSHMRSSFQQVEASDWDKAVMLPLQSWSINPNKKYAGSPPY